MAYTQYNYARALKSISTCKLFCSILTIRLADQVLNNFWFQLTGFFAHFDGRKVAEY